MSSIYRSAQLTIIAAAGSNPLYGLPGVRKHRSLRPLISHAEIGHLCFSKVPTDTTLADIYMADIAESKWASRAWTYQEALFSQKRLIFTDRQVLFNCNAKTCLESGIAVPNQDLAFLGSLWNHSGLSTFDGVPSKYQSVWDYSDRSHSVHRLTSSMEHYCCRNLTNDSDALNAILSTLEEFSGSDCYHIWGVPVGPHPKGCQSEGYRFECRSGNHRSKMIDLWLSWHHPKKGSRRRPGFPSWSPLGWANEPIEWNIFGHLTGAVQLRTRADVKPFSDYLPYGKRNPNEMPQLLQVPVRTIQGLVLDPDHEDGRSFLLSIGHGYHIQGLAHWDDDTAMEYDSLKIAMIEEFRFDVAVLLLKSVSDHYERVGYSRLKGDSLSDFSSLWIQQGELSSPKYRRIEPCSTSDAWGTDEKRLREYFGSLDNRNWMENVFKEEYITLG